MRSVILLDDEILELLKELKQGQEEIEKNLSFVERATAKIWGDVARLKAVDLESSNDTGNGINFIKEDVKKLADITKQNCYDIAYIKGLIRENESTHSINFFKNKIREIEEDVFLVKEKVTKQE